MIVWRILKLAASTGIVLAMVAHIARVCSFH